MVPKEAEGTLFLATLSHLFQLHMHDWQHLAVTELRAPRSKNTHGGRKGICQISYPLLSLFFCTGLRQVIISTLSQKPFSSAAIPKPNRAQVEQSNSLASGTEKPNVGEKPRLVSIEQLNLLLA